MTATVCEGCSQPLLLHRPGRTHCARCRDPWTRAGWVGNAYRLDALGELLPGVAGELAEIAGTGTPTEKEQDR